MGDKYGTRQGVLRKHIAYRLDTCGGRELTVLTGNEIETNGLRY